MVFTTASKSEALRVTRVSRWSSAVAAMNASRGSIGRPKDPPRATSFPPASAISRSTGKILPSKREVKSVRGHPSRRSRRLPLARRSMPKRNSAMVTTLRKTLSSSTSPNQATGSGLFCIRGLDTSAASARRKYFPSLYVQPFGVRSPTSETIYRSCSAFRRQPMQSSPDNKELGGFVS